MSKPLATDKFRFDGRGPQLRRAVWDNHGTTLLAVEYADVDGSLRHVRFHAPQVAMFTPEEVATQLAVGAMDLGRSEWLQSFNPTHLVRCRHFRLPFYDELLDIICESLEFADAAFAPPA